MQSTINQDNALKNKSHYDTHYSAFRVERILDKLHHLDHFLNDAIQTDTSWLCMYQNNFKSYLKGKKVLELGCGDCTNAAVMTALGAEVWANDISDKAEEIINELNSKVDFKYPITFIKGNFLELNLPQIKFDIVVGKAFVHHLTPEQEIEFLRRISSILKPEGMVRYVEPAINSKLLDNLRWMVPVKGRPSSFQRKKFKEWVTNDPHPVRDNSGEHFKTLGEKWFKEVEITPVGAIERFHRLFPNSSWNRAFRRKAFKMEQYLPHLLKYKFARTQTIDYRFPKSELS